MGVRRRMDIRVRRWRRRDTRRYTGGGGKPDLAMEEKGFKKGSMKKRYHYRFGLWGRRDPRKGQ